MSQPISPSPFDKVIREAGKVRTKGGYATLISILLFMCFFFALFLTKDLLQWVLSIMILACLVGFAIFAFRHVKGN